jgi:hypothetical protein
MFLWTTWAILAIFWSSDMGSVTTETSSSWKLHQGRPLRLMEYNPQSAVGVRVIEVGEALNATDASGIIGTGIWTEEQVEYRSSENFIHIAAGRSRRGNSSLGVSLCLPKKIFNLTDIVESVTSPAWLIRGRVLKVRVVQGRADYTFFCIYWPHASSANFKAIVDAINDWLDRQAGLQPTRTSMFIFCDFNGGFGWFCDEAGTRVHRSDSIAEAGTVV